jgi:chromosome segregation ATPase
MSPTRGDSAYAAEFSISMQAIEVAQLKQQIEYMTGSENQLIQELNLIKAELAKKKDEAFKFAGDVSKSNRAFKQLESQMTTLQERTRTDITNMAAKLDRATKLQEKQEKSAQKAIADFQSQLALKNQKIEQLNENLVDVKHLLKETMDENAELCAAQNETADQPKAPQLDPNQAFAFLQVPVLKEQIADLKKEIARFNGLHSGDCDTYATTLLGKMSELLEDKAVADVEIEGLKHLHTANEKLTSHCSDLTRQITQLALKNQLAQAQISELEESMEVEHIEKYFGVDSSTATKPALGLSSVEETISVLPVAFGDNRAEMNAALQKVRIAETQVKMLKDANNKLQAAVSPKQTLVFSAVSETLSTSPVAAHDHKANLAAATQALRIAELDMETLEGEKCIIQCEGAKLVLANTSLRSKLAILQVTNTELQSKLATVAAAQQQARKLDFSIVQTASSSPIEPVKLPLTFSTVQTQSTTPISVPPGLLPSGAASKLSPELFAQLNSIGQSIMSLSSPSPPTIKHRPNVAVTVNNQPPSRSWSLLKHGQGAISGSSSLDIHGPKPLVQEFVSGMHKLETERAESVAVAKQLQKVVAELMGEIEELKRQMKRMPRCTMAAHRNLRDELEAKELQYKIQSQLLADWQKRSSRQG